eukprot:UN10129
MPSNFQIINIIIIGSNPALEQHIFLVLNSFFANISQLCGFFYLLIINRLHCVCMSGVLNNSKMS